MTKQDNLKDSKDALETGPKTEGAGAASTEAAGPGERAELVQMPQRPGAGPGRRPGGMGGGKPGPGRGAAKEPPTVIVRPLPAAAAVKRRHRGLLYSLAAVVLIPLFVTALYLGLVARNQYASTVGFTVRQEDGTSGATSLLGGLSQFVGTSGGSRDSDILYEFIQSQEIVSDISQRIDLVGLYSKNWPWDPVFALSPNASIEDLLRYWQRMVRISYDQSAGLIEVRVLAFSPEDAQKIASEVVRESQKMINDLNTTAREDTMRYALEDLDTSLSRLKTAREAMTQFRTRTQMVDPASDLAGRMGVLNNLQQQLAQSLIDRDLLRDQKGSPGDDPRLDQANRRIDVIRQQIVKERQSFTSATGEPNSLPENYPNLISEYERLNVDQQFAEETYRAALAAVDVARANAARQSRYLAAYVRPTLPETSEFPRSWVILGLMALFLTLAWAIAAMVFYSIRDRR